MSYDPHVDRYEIATMIVGVAAIIAAYFGPRLGPGVRLSPRGT
jgi:hypothetical protein